MHNWVSLAKRNCEVAFTFIASSNLRGFLWKPIRAVLRNSVFKRVRPWKWIYPARSIFIPIKWINKKKFSLRQLSKNCWPSMLLYLGYRLCRFNLSGSLFRAVLTRVFTATIKDAQIWVDISMKDNRDIKNTWASTTTTKGNPI